VTWARRWHRTACTVVAECIGTTHETPSDELQAAMTRP